MDPTRRRRQRSVLFLLPCVSLTISPNHHHQVYAFSNSPSIKSSFPLSIQSSVDSLSSSPFTSVPTNHKSQLKASPRMRTFLTSTDKDTEPSSLERNGQTPTTTVVNGKSSSANVNQRLSVMDKVSGMFKISAPNLSLPKPVSISMRRLFVNAQTFCQFHHHHRSLTFCEISLHSPFLFLPNGRERLLM